MSNETLEEKEQELKELEKQIEQVAEAEKEKAAQETQPSPDQSTSSVLNAEPAPLTNIIPDQSQGQKPKDDPLEWAKAKGFKSPEDMARALLAKEQEFHKRNQAGHPGYKDINPVQTPEWQPRPEAGYPQQQYQPSYPTHGNSFQELASLYPQIDPDDLRRFMPVVIDAAQAIAKRERQELEKQITGIQRSTERNNEVMALMQDPAFRDNRVQKEIHAILDADPSIFQRERAPLVHAYEKAMVNLARKQLQQSVTSEGPILGNTPPITAGGGNGSAYTSQQRITEREFDSWSLKDQEAFINSKGRILPKK